MISNQVIQTSINELKEITKVDFAVIDMDNMLAATTFDMMNLDKELIQGFAGSPADSQIIGGFHLLKIMDEGEVVFILIAQGSGPEVYIYGKIAVSQIQNLVIAYKEKFDRNNFFQNLLLDNLLLVDIYNRAKRLRIDVELPRAVFVVEARNDKENNAKDVLRSLMEYSDNDYVTAVDEKSIILIKALDKNDGYEVLENTAKMIVDTMNTEAMLNARVSYGTIVSVLKDVSKSYKEAMMALDVGKIFYGDKKIIAYNTLGIGRLIYQLPDNLCRMFMKEIFGQSEGIEMDEETLTTINKFFENNLNVSETSRQLFVHRNTLVYRIEKLEKSTGLDVRTFDDALTFKIAMMVGSYLRYNDSKQF